MPYESSGYPHTPKIAPIQLPVARDQPFKKFEITREYLNPQLEEWQKALDDYSAESQKMGGGAPLALDLTIQDRLANKFGRPKIFDSWPAGWYVPRDGDWTKIWPSAPPHGSADGVPDRGAPGPRNGRLWAWAHAPSDVVSVEAQAGLGFVFTPTAQLVVKF